MCLAVSGFALTQGEYVYTPQGRFQITGDNLNANNSFADFSGWTVATAAEGKTIADIFNMNANGYADGLNSIQSVDATAGEGMYYRFVPTSASDTYIVSFKMRGEAGASIRTSNVATGSNNVIVQGNTDGTFGGATDAIICNKAEELTTEWKTFNYAIQGDGTPRIYFISFTGIETTVEVADVQIASAMQFADLRKRDAMVDKINAYKNVYAWPEKDLNDFGINEVLENLASVGDKTGQAVLDEFLATAEEILAEFINENMDDYFGLNVDNYFVAEKATKNYSKVSTIGEWSCLPSGRAWFGTNYNLGVEFGHYQSGSTWNHNDATQPMGISMQKEMTVGSYVFAIEGIGGIRENVKYSWYNDEGLVAAYGVAYIKKVTAEGAEATAADTLLAVVKDMDLYAHKPFIVPVQISENGNYEIGIKVYCKPEYQDLQRGSVVYLKNASLWGKNNNKYTQKQLAYEADVREMITTGRSNLNTAVGNLANAEKPWGKDELQACVDTVAPRIEAYEAMSQDDIIATYDGDIYNKSTSSEDGLLVYTVYQEAVKDIIAANRKFNAVNDTLGTMQTAIEAAETVLAQRVYDAATGKAALQAAIDEAKGVQAQMKAAQYSEENAAAILAANDKLAEAVEAFKASVPASAVTTVVDIDFTKAAVQDEITLLYNIPGNAGTMEFSTFSTSDSPAEKAFEKGLLSNGELLYPNYIRVGNGTGTVNFNPGDMGTDILKFTFDFYIQGLSGRNLGFFIKGQQVSEESEPTDVTIGGFYANFYNNSINTNTFGIALSSLKYGSGSSYDNAAPEGAEGATGTVCAKNSFEVILDFGEKSMYCVTNSANGTVTAHKYQFDGTVPTSFVVQSDYHVASRRCWFSNLKVDRIKAGAPVNESSNFILASDEAKNLTFHNVGSGSQKEDNWMIELYNGGSKVASVRADWWDDVTDNNGDFTYPYSFSKDGGKTVSADNIWNSFTTDMQNADCDFNVSYTNGTLYIIGTMTNGSNVYYVNYAKSGLSGDVTVLYPYGNNATLSDITIADATVNTTWATAEGEPVTVTSAGMATYVSAYPLDFSKTGIAAYKVKVKKQGEATLTKVGAVPAGTPVLLYKDGGATENIPIVASAETVSDNDLVAGTVTTATDGVPTEDGKGYTNMILNNIGGNVGFYFAAGNTVATNRAYLHIATSLAPYAVSGARSMEMVFDGTPTGVESITPSTIEKGKGTIYTLCGQRVAQPTKGLYIVNGKKVSIK